MKIMQFTSKDNLGEDNNIIDTSLIKIIETETDNREVEKSLIEEDEEVLGFWDKSTWDKMKDLES